MRKKITNISFGESVKKLSYDEFMARFQPIYPDADLNSYAAELGIKPVAIKEEKPYGGRRRPASVKLKGFDTDITTPEPNPTDERTDAGAGEHEADEEGLH
ncbi:hypothetical protein ACFOTA_06895 [Chitinophaga sp. GCM10012297]|uniref:Uncharacterized protein n=1 Tax=Chitinophaga chungangae TaxID=2821488 RepID=A0ABS3YB78_9BACT|nr:hypothetical protein [Chitinophaga chungangae]MBO9151926.1 hypothetical protein [Chitinophaga chungangae]